MHDSWFSQNQRTKTWYSSWKRSCQLTFDYFQDLKLTFLIWEPTGKLSITIHIYISAIVGRSLATSCEILVAGTQFLVALVPIIELKHLKSPDISNKNNHLYIALAHLIPHHVSPPKTPCDVVYAQTHTCNRNFILMWNKLF